MIGGALSRVTKYYYIQNDLLREAGLLYIKSLRRKPSTEDITVSYKCTCYADGFILAFVYQQAIVRALQQESRNRNKFFKAKTFVSNRLTELRCEERRRVSVCTVSAPSAFTLLQIFGVRPCENFVNFTTSEFAERFFSTAKTPTVSGEVRSQYIRHLTLLVMLCAVVFKFHSFFSARESMQERKVIEMTLSKSLEIGWIESTLQETHNRMNGQSQREKMPSMCMLQTQHLIRRKIITKKMLICLHPSILKKPDDYKRHIKLF